MEEVLLQKKHVVALLLSESLTNKGIGTKLNLADTTGRLNTTSPPFSPKLAATHSKQIAAIFSIAKNHPHRSLPNHSAIIESFWLKLKLKFMTSGFVHQGKTFRKSKMATTPLQRANLRCGKAMFFRLSAKMTLVEVMRTMLIMALSMFVFHQRLLAIAAHSRKQYYGRHSHLARNHRTG